jgi:hypothetical protein
LNDADIVSRAISDLLRPSYFLELSSRPSAAAAIACLPLGAKDVRVVVSGLLFGGAASRTLDLILSLEHLPGGGAGQAERVAEVHLDPLRAPPPARGLHLRPVECVRLALRFGEHVLLELLQKRALLKRHWTCLVRDCTPIAMASV